MDVSTPTENVLLATRRANGDYRYTKSALAKWCTEALVEAAYSVTVPTKFSEPLPTWRDATRAEALMFLCGWAHAQRLAEWLKEYDAARQAAILALPEALTELGAAL